MRVSELITPEGVACSIKAGSKKRALEHISGLVTKLQPSLDQAQVFDNLIARERLGSTGIGHGVAIPHSRIKNCGKPIGIFIQLANGIDYDAIDNEPVDLLFALLVPEDATDEHLEVLAMLAEMFSNEQFRENIHQAKTSQQLFDLLAKWEPVH